MSYARLLAAAICGFSLGAASAHAAPTKNEKVATIQSVDASGSGKSLGTIAFSDTEKGLMIVTNLVGLPAGEHGFHIHAVGKCEPPFTSAGPHFNPNEKKHGLRSREGRSGGMWRAATWLGAGSLIATLARRPRLAGALGTAAALIARLAVVDAGRASAADPRATFQPQRRAARAG